MPERMRVVIVDDEAPARSILREYLGGHAGVEVVAECANGFEAVKAILDQRPEIVFLDVQMPKLDGFEVLELLEPDPRAPGSPAIVFCTAFDEYALKAFEVHAVDYLLKPFGRERLAEAIGRARDRLEFAAGRAAAGASKDAGPAPASAAAAAAPDGAALARTARGPGRYAERIVVRDGAQVHVIPAERVDWVEAQDDYVAIHSGGKAHLKHQALAELAEGLDPARFVRIHRSYLANVERIARIELLAKDQRVAVLHDGRQLPVSRSGHERLRELLR
jgi:two-component system LytT family response regulator